MRKTRQLIIAALSMFTWSVTLFAGPIDQYAARQLAANFLNQKTTRTVNTSELSLKYNSATTYLFENATDFALVAADDALPAILGYGSKHDGPTPPAMEGYLKAMKFTPSKHQHKYEPVEALLPFVRHQKAPYNKHCPYFVDSKGTVTEYQCVVGCVATALEEIISYYRRTVVLQDTLHGWESKKHTPIADILPGTTVDCQLIRNNYDIDQYTPEEADAVSRLSYYCGVAAHMNWGIEASGANITNLVKPLKEAFGYGYVKYVDSYKYSPEDWLKMMRGEIQARRPILYTGFNMWLGGHAFVVDGLDENGFFHVNWGYAGSYDGYFRLDVLNYNEPPLQMTPEGMEAGFFTNHQALLLHPDKIEVTHPDTLTRTGLEIAVDKLQVDLQAETNKHTPITVTVRNTTEKYLTTPFELFTNSPKDTAIFEQGDFVALSAAILAPHEVKKLKIHANFEEAGERILRISPDDKAIIYETPIVILDGKAPLIDFHEPQIEFPSANEAFVTLEVCNSDTAGRGGQEVLYEMGLGDAATMKDGVRHSRHLYVKPGETLKDTIRFRYLIPGQTYTLLVRSPWKIQTQKTFVMPETSGIENNVLKPVSSQIEWYTTNGIRLSAPQQNGIYLRKEGEHIQKIYINKQNKKNYDRH